MSAQHRLLGARVLELHVAQLDLAARSAPRSTGGRRRRPTASVSSTSPMRSAETAARGTIISMNVAIMTDIRICIR